MLIRWPRQVNASRGGVPRSGATKSDSAQSDSSNVPGLQQRAQQTTGCLQKQLRLLGSHHTIGESSVVCEKRWTKEKGNMGTLGDGVVTGECEEKRGGSPKRKRPEQTLLWFCCHVTSQRKYDDNDHTPDVTEWVSCDSCCDVLNRLSCHVPPSL